MYRLSRNILNQRSYTMCAFHTINDKMYDVHVDYCTSSRISPIRRCHLNNILNRRYNHHSHAVVLDFISKHNHLFRSPLCNDIAKVSGILKSNSLYDIDRKIHFIDDFIFKPYRITTNPYSNDMFMDIVISLYFDSQNTRHVTGATCVMVTSSNIFIIFDDDKSTELFETCQKDLSRKDILRLSRGFFQAIHELHRLQFIHNDIKFENAIYNNKSGIVKLIDYGTIQPITHDLGTNHIVYGTLEYTSPSSIQTKIISPWSDIYSAIKAIACILSGHQIASLPSYSDPYKLIQSINLYDLWKLNISEIQIVLNDNLKTSELRRYLMMVISSRLLPSIRLISNKDYNKYIVHIIRLFDLEIDEYD